ncbi:MULTISPECIES: YMGG-like glycine zipper-containing protein [Pasteurellaceae]|uniref:YMGG-like glycine zipper-containing protein n=1 Tax=Pasteurellaceae TaxID=712 RepID=UPI003568A132
MKSLIVKSLAIVVVATSVSTGAMALERQQKDTAVGALLGGAAGAVIGNDVVSTVAGAALGGVIGSQWNANKYDRDRKPRDFRPHPRAARDVHPGLARGHGPRHEARVPHVERAHHKHR